MSVAPSNSFNAPLLRPEAISFPSRTESDAQHLVVSDGCASVCELFVEVAASQIFSSVADRRRLWSCRRA